jgi:hypothetical protein
MKYMFQAHFQNHFTSGHTDVDHIVAKQFISSIIPVKIPVSMSFCHGCWTNMKCCKLYKTWPKGKSPSLMGLNFTSPCDFDWR